MAEETNPHTHGLAAAASPRGGQEAAMGALSRGQEADPPATPSESGDALEPSGGGVHDAGSGGGAGRPTSQRSIGTVIANTSMDTALGVPVEVLDERAHGREAIELLLVAAAEQWRHNRLMPAERLLDLEAVVAHMVEARGLRGGS